MVITNFEQTQADERVKLPRDELAKPPTSKLEHELVLNVGFYRDIEGKKTDPRPWIFNFGPEAQEIEPLQSEAQLKQEARIFGLKPDVEVEDVTIRIRADSEVQTGVIQELIEICQGAGFEKFALAAMSGPEQ